MSYEIDLCRRSEPPFLSAVARSVSGARITVTSRGKPVATAILSWADAFDVADSTFEAMRAADDPATDHQMPIRDALILSVAADQKCRLLLSEDFQHGFTWTGVTVLNPFQTPQHWLPAAVLQ